LHTLRVDRKPIETINCAEKQQNEKKIMPQSGLYIDCMPPIENQYSAVSCQGSLPLRIQSN